MIWQTNNIVHIHRLLVRVYILHTHRIAWNRFFDGKRNGSRFNFICILFIRINNITTRIDFIWNLSCAAEGIWFRIFQWVAVFYKISNRNEMDFPFANKPHFCIRTKYKKRATDMNVDFQIHQASVELSWVLQPYTERGFCALHIFRWTETTICPFISSNWRNYLLQ